MGMPQIPDGKNRPSFRETIIDLLESVALEEMAISHIINAEGEKLQEIIRSYCGEEINFCELECSCKSAQSMMNTMIMKEWLLLNKLNTIMDVKNNMEPECYCCEQCNSRRHRHSSRCNTCKNRDQCYGNVEEENMQNKREMPQDYGRNK